MVDQRTEFEIALKDNITEQLKEISRQLRELNKLAKESGELHVATVEHLQKSHHNLAQTARETLRRFNEFGKSVIDFGKDVLGVGGVVAGIKQTARAVNELVVSQTQLRNFSHDTNFTVEHIESMRDALSAMGMTTAESNKIISTFANKIQGLETFREGSPLYMGLADMKERGREFAQHLLGEIGDYEQVMKDILQFYQTLSPRAQKYFAQMLGVSPAVLMEMADIQQEIDNKLGPRYKMNEAELRRYMVNTTVLTKYMEDEFKRFADHALPDINKVLEDIRAYTENNHGLSEWLIGEFEAIKRGIEQEKEDFEVLKKWFENFTNFWANRPDEETTKMLEDAKRKALHPELRGELGEQKLDNIKQGYKLLDDIDRILKRFSTTAIGFGAANYWGSAAPAYSSAIGDGGTGKPGGAAGAATETGTGSDKSGAAGDPAVPSDVLATAEKVALLGGAGAVSDFMRKQGYPKNGAWCGEFAASVIKAAGGTPPRNPEVASNWRNYGAPVDVPQPGDVAIRRGVPTGSTGSHVTIVEGVDPQTGRFVGIGGNQGGIRSSFPLRGYEYRRGSTAEERDRLDKNSIWNKPSADITFSFRNVPSGVKTNADADGMFDNVRVDRSKAMSAQE
jgi:uncharacterized protein (TIGR02594 family)